MQERLNQYRPILAVLIVACGLMAAVTSRYDMTLFYICLGAWALLSLGCIIWMTVITRQNRRRFGRLKDSLERIMSDAVLSLPMPSLIVRESGEVVWSNPPAKQGVFPGQELFGHNIAELVPGLDWQAESSAEGRDIVIGERHYTVFLMHSSSTKEPLTIICLVDDNDLKHYTQEYFDSRPYVLTMLIDNYSELFTDAKENERSRTMGQIEHIIETFAEENHGLVKKLDRDRFLAVVEERYMKRVIEDRFPILNAIRAVDTGDRNNATMSIGVSPMAASLHESETISRQALDMALGRGGDQVALRQKNGYEFFGGTGRGVEKRNKVRARIMANAITEVATTCDNILIMGHRFADLDCLGAAIGMYAGLSTLGKPCSIVLDTEKSLAQPLYRHMLQQDKRYEDAFVSPAQGLDMVGRNTLLVVVDTHIPSILESREIYEACRNVIVIDHHRKGVGFIEHADLVCHEPYSSSASELVTELLQYVGDRDDKPSRVEAEGLLSGIMLDTRDFTLHTGVRTFEAAAALRRYGAETERVRQLFDVTMVEYNAKADLVEAAQMYRSCAISVSGEVPPEARVAIAQAANDLLTIQNVEASFVAVQVGNGVNISARSLGAVNVQVIMESLGGGGHQTMAAAQLKHITPEAARARIQTAIDQYRESQKKPLSKNEPESRKKEKQG